MTNRILITGAQGFVGRYLVAYYLSSVPDVEIVGVGRSSFTSETFTHFLHYGNHDLRAPLSIELKTDGAAQYKYVSIDIRHKAALSRVLREFRPRTIFHLASALREATAEQLFQTNVLGTLALVEAIAESGVSVTKLLIASTGGVYGEAPDSELPLKETVACLPIDLYGVSKLASEHASRILARQHAIPTIWARIFNLIGAGQQEIHVCARIASQLASVKAGAVPRVIQVGSLDSTRDFIDVRDVAVGLELLARIGKPGEVYNLASGREVSIRSVLETLLMVVNMKQVKIERVLEQRPAIRRHVAKVERLAALGFHPKYDLNQSAAALVSYYLQEVTHSAQTLWE